MTRGSVSPPECGAWRIVEWRGDALGRRLFLGQLCWVRARETTQPMIGEIVELEADARGERLVRVKLWVRALKTTLPRRPIDTAPLEPRPALRLVSTSDPEEMIA
jgi:hypothetical protein